MPPNRLSRQAQTWSDLKSGPTLYCPICYFEVSSRETGPLQAAYAFSCKVCGQFHMRQEVYEQHLVGAGSEMTKLDANASAMVRLTIAYWIAGKNDSGVTPDVDEGTIRSALNAPLQPSPRRLMNNIIVMLARQPLWASYQIRQESFARLGALNEAEVESACEELLAARLIRLNEEETARRFGRKEYRLTLDGWDRFERIKDGRAEGRAAFLAMKFGTDLDATYKPVVEAACTNVGFKLNRLDDVPEPGLIDVMMEAAIRQSSFLIADLTYDSSGAYWEAGFAHGLGKPVIYTCRKGAGVHFDVRNWQRIEWQATELGLLQRRLEAMLRLSIPGAR
jgi:hypothetical protein